MRQHLLLLCVLLTQLQHSSAQTLTNSTDCDCFLTNGTTPAYFTSHSFYDWRNVARSQVAAPDIPTTVNVANSGTLASSFFTSDSWNSNWNIANWNNTDAPTTMINTFANIYIENADVVTSTYKTHLTLRTNRQPTFQTTAELDTLAQNYQHISVRWLARVIGSPGACAGLFTYRENPSAASQTTSLSRSEDVQEADIEILTSGPRNKIQYTNQPSNNPTTGAAIPQSTVNGTMTGSLADDRTAVVDWSTWNVLRYDWTPGLSEWYINGVRNAAISFQAPVAPAGLIMNLWSNGDTWTGNMSVNEYAYLQIQWMEIVFNSSGPVTGSKRRRDADMGLVSRTVDMVDEDLLRRREMAEVRGHERQKRASAKGCVKVCSVDADSSAPGNVTLVVNNAAVVLGPHTSIAWSLLYGAFWIWISSIAFGVV